MTTEFRIGVVGTVDDWNQKVVLPYSESSPGTFTVLPKNGQLTISRPAPAGARAYWNGSAWVEGPEIVLATTIIGNASHYGFTATRDLLGVTVRFHGWLNGFRGVSHTVEVLYQDNAAGISFGSE